MTAPLLSALAPAEVATARPSVEALDVLGDTVLRIRACTGDWFFNLDRSRFCVAGAGTDPFFLAPGSWQGFAELHLAPDDTSFHVVVDPEGARGLWGHRHDAGCPRC